MTELKGTLIPDMLIDYLSEQQNITDVLDLGCGTGCLSEYVALRCPLWSIIGYDIDGEKIRKLQNRRKDRQNVTFTSKRPERLFDIVLACAVIHEDPLNIAEEISSLVRPGGYVGIIDYDMKDVTYESFFDAWKLAEELYELRNLGHFMTYQMHTHFGLDDCIDLMEKNGFLDIASRGNIERIFPGHLPPTKHFIYIGEKNH